MRRDARAPAGGRARARPRCRRAPAGSAFPACVALLLSLLASPAPPASAQILRREPPPWIALEVPAARRAVAFDVARYNDARVDWSAQRFAVTVLLPQGTTSCLFARFSWLTLDTGARSAPARWPGIVGEKAPAGWPAEARDVGWGGPEVGTLGNLGLPLLGGLQYALQAGLPVGRDVLYPFASTSLPISVELRKPWRVGSAWETSLRAGRTWNLGTGRDVLASDAFPRTFTAGLDLARHPHERRAIVCDLAAEWGDGRRLMTAGIVWRLPVGATDAFALSAEREVLGRDDRPFALRIAATWLFAGLAEAKPPVAK